MKGIILCAGKGTRLKPITDSIPKTLLPIANRTILDRCIDQLIDVGIYEIAVVINPSQHQIVEHLQQHPSKKNISIIYQEKALGILHAMFQAQSFIGKDDFVMLLGDNVFSGSLLPLIQSFHGNQGAIYLSKVKNPQEFGIAEVKENQIISLEEKPKSPKSNLAVIGVYVFHSTIFQTQKVIGLSPRGEYEITDAIQWLINQGYPVAFTITDEWFMDVGTPERWLLSSLKLLEMEHGTKINVSDGTKIENCTLFGPVIIGKNCRLTNTTIGPNVSIQDGSELYDCVIENSIVGKNVQLREEKITHSIFVDENRFVIKRSEKGI